MKKAVSKKLVGKKPGVKQEEQFRWAVVREDCTYPEDNLSEMTEAEALKELARWCEGDNDKYTLYKLVPMHVARIPSASACITCLATGETTTITL